MLTSPDYINLSDVVRPLQHMTWTFAEQPITIPSNETEEEKKAYATLLILKRFRETPVSYVSFALFHNI